MHSKSSKITRIEQILRYCNYSRKSIAAHCGITERTLHRYSEGQRLIPFQTAIKMMNYIGMDPNFLHNDAPLKRKLTGFTEVDNILRNIYNAPELARMDEGVCVADPVAEHFTDHYRCCSSTYSDFEVDRHQSVGVDEIEWFETKIGKTKTRYAVDRQTEWASFCERVGGGQKVQTSIVQAQVVNHDKLMVVARSRWISVSTFSAWTTHSEMETIDQLKLTHNLDDICAQTHPFLIRSKLWTQYMGNPSHEMMSESVAWLAKLNN